MSAANRVTTLSVLAAALAAVVVTDVVAPAQGTRSIRLRATTTPVVGTSVVCPDVSGNADTTTVVTAVAHPAQPAGSGQLAQSMTALPLGRRGPATQLARRPDTVATVTSTSAGGPLQITATGALAAGFTARQTTRTDTGAGRGVASNACVAPATSWWFTGVSGALGVHDVLQVANIDADPALINVRAWGPKGPVAAPAARGLAVAPHSILRLSVDHIVPDQSPAVLHVVAVRGRVAASVSDQQDKNGYPHGVDGIPAQTRPRRNAVIPGVLGGGGTRWVTLADVGARDATVTVHIIDARGQHVPVGMQAVSVPAGTTKRLVLPTAGASAGLLISSDVPVLSSVLADEYKAPIYMLDVAVTAPVPPLAGPTAVTDVRTAAGVSTFLMLTAPRTAATVRITAPGHPQSRTLTVAGATSASVNLAALAAPWVVVTPVSGGPVYAASAYVEAALRGPLISVLPLTTSPTRVTVPAIVPDVSVG